MTQVIETPKMSAGRTALLIAAVLAVVVIVVGVAWWFWGGAQPIKLAALRELLLKALICWVLATIAVLLVWKFVLNGIRNLMFSAQSLPTVPEPEVAKPDTCRALRTRLTRDHGRLWRRKTRVLLVIGEPEQIEAIAPGLTQHQWLIGQNTVLLWGGSTQTNLSDAFKRWHGLSRWRPLDGVVWALDKNQSADGAAMRVGVQQVQGLAQTLCWQLPLYVWQVCASEWKQDGREEQPVGCLLPAPFTAEQLEAGLGELVQPLQQLGIAQVEETMSHDFLWRLSYDLQTEGIARWRKALSPLLGYVARQAPLRGLWFSLPLQRAQSEGDNTWPPEESWLGVVEDRNGNPRRLGGHPARVWVRAAH